MLDGDVAMVATMQRRKCTPSTTFLVRPQYWVTSFPVYHSCYWPGNANTQKHLATPSKLTNINVSGTVRYCHALSGIIRYYHVLLSIVGQCWTLLNIVGHYRALLDTTEHCWTLLRIIGDCWTPLDTIKQ